MATVIQVSASKGGVPKLPLLMARVTVNGLEGDRQRDRRFHGGPERALCLYSMELIEALRGEGHPIQAGAVGENVTIAGLDWRLVEPGVRLRMGEVLAEVTSYTVPCKTIRNAFLDMDFTRISQKLHPGWSRVYVRILEEGVVKSGDAVEME